MDIISNRAAFRRGLGCTLTLLALAAASNPRQSAELSEAPLTTLRIGVLGSAREFHPWRVAEDSALEFVYGLTSHPIVGLDEFSQWRCYLCIELPRPSGLGVKVIQVKNHPKKLDVSWKINDKATWGDGVPVTGYDVQFSWKAGRLPAARSSDADIYGAIERVSVDQSDPKQFTISFNRADQRFLTLPGFKLLPRHVEQQAISRLDKGEGTLQDSSTYFTAPFTAGLYNGPYTLSGRPTPNTFELTANPHYYGKSTPWTKVVIEIENSVGALLDKFESGTIDLIAEVNQGLADTDSIRRWAQGTTRKGIGTVRRVGSGVMEHLTFNLRNPSLADARLRRALIAAINREDIAMLLPEDSVEITDKMFRPDDPLGQLSGMKPAPKQPEKASSLLHEANWVVSSDGIARQDGETLTIELAIPAGDQFRGVEAEAIAANWRKLGIGASIKTLPREQFFGRVVRRAGFTGAILFAWERSAQAMPVSILDSREIPTSKNDYWGQNISGWENKRVDRIFDRFGAAKDASEAGRMLGELEDELERDAPMAPLYFVTRRALMAKKVGKYTPSPNQFPASLWIEKWNQ